MVKMVLSVFQMTSKLNELTHEWVDQTLIIIKKFVRKRNLKKNINAQLNFSIARKYFFLLERFACGCDVIQVNIGQVYVNICHRVAHRLIITR